MTLGRFGRRPTAVEQRAVARRERKRLDEVEEGGPGWGTCYACAGDPVERRRCKECHGRGGWRQVRP